MVFGCAGLEHYLAPDASSLRLTSPDELAGQWLNLVTAEIDRDWTWKGQTDPTIRIKRTIRLLPSGTGSPATPVGEMQLHHVVPLSASDGAPERDRTRVVFVDAFAPPLDGDIPREIEVSYRVTAHLEGGASQALEVTDGGDQRDWVTNRLPVTTRPDEAPRVVSAGHALSPYHTDAAYRSTATRQRMLWIELAGPPHNPADAYFARVVAHAPDPLLLAEAESAADPPAYDQPALDPELARIILPGQPADTSGLAAFQRLIPARLDDAAGAEQVRHYLVPLPPGVSPASPELFGFYTYEIRVGHDQPLWSTAQGRFGPPLVLEGVQHPCPPISCSVSRQREGLQVAADFAKPYFQGQDVLPSPPASQVWVVLYAQICQADGTTRRNEQLDVKQAWPAPRRIVGGSGSFERVHGTPRQTTGFASWTQADLNARLTRLGLATDSSLSVLAVEVLPEPNMRAGDPLGRDLGQIRVLRTSPLTAVNDLCC